MIHWHISNKDLKNFETYSVENLFYTEYFRQTIEKARKVKKYYIIFFDAQIRLKCLKFDQTSLIMSSK